MRDNDSIVTASHFNSVSNRLVLAFANSKFLTVLDLSAEDATSALYWRLPALCGESSPLVFASDMDKLLVGYDSNQIAVFDLLNKQIHPWTQSNLNSLPRNFLNRYNKFAGVIQLSDSKYLLYTSYTFCTLDLAQQVPAQVEMVQNHPSKSLVGK